jgi:hypothetical protein
LTENEHNFLKKICLNALSVDKNVGFVAAVDNNGKMLAGEFNKSRSFKNSNTLIKSSIFYLHYLIPAIRQQEDYSHDTIHNNNIFHSSLVDLGNTVYLAVIALNEKKKDRYVCIYIESKPETTSKTKTKSSHELIISKIIATLRLFFYLASTKCNEYCPS